MTTHSRFVPGLTAILLAMAMASPLRADDPALDRFRADIDAAVRDLAPGSSGILELVGADPFEIRRDSDTLIAVITGARLKLHTDEVLHLALDRLEVRQTPSQNGGETRDLTVLLPKQVIFTEADGTETSITLEDGRVDAVIDARSGRTRDMGLAVAGTRVDQAKTGAWISFGPAAMSSKLVAEPGGRWNAPTGFELKKVEFSFPQAPAGGATERIAFTSLSAGPKVDEIEQLRDTLAVLERDKEAPLDVRLARLLGVLPTIPSVFGSVRGDAVLEGLSVRGDTDEPLVSLTKAEFATGVTGFDGDVAALRFTIRAGGLELAPSLLEARLVPHRAIIDFGVENLSTAALSILLRGATLSGSGDDAEQQQAGQQMLGALALLNPVGRIYEMAVDTQDVGAEVTAEAKGTPLSPTGYTAAGDLVVRGWEALPRLAAGTPFIEYLPFLAEFAEAVTPPDGSPRLKYHIASNPPKWAMINGHDVSPWFEEDEPAPGQPRLLKPAEPPLQGADVKDVQRALAAAQLPVEQDGVYRVSTATAVARFQKQKGLNVSGVVDAPTRQALGLRAPAPRPAGRE